MSTLFRPDHNISEDPRLGDIFHEYSKLAADTSGKFAQITKASNSPERAHRIERMAALLNRTTNNIHKVHAWMSSSRTEQASDALQENTAPTTPSGP